ncbi:MAG: hypothetical protein LAO56_15750 [Acidobacteriia bacterium]|nr:hypothetical protein [Terriglobia bacterium]
MKRALKFAGGAVVALGTLASLAVCQESRVYRDGSNWMQEIKGDLGGARNLRVKLEAGSVRVEGGSQSGVSYVIHRRSYTSSEQSARREFERYKIEAYVRGDTAFIEAQSRGGRNRECSGDFVIHVPRAMELAKIETDGGSVTATGIAGRAEVESGGGSIHIDDIGGPVTAETGGGSIEVGNVGSDVSLQTGGGNIKIISAKGKINAESGAGNVVVLSGLQGAVLETGAGSIRVEKCAGKVRATTGGGSVDFGEIGGAAEIESGAGSIRLSSAKGPVWVQTGGGSIQLDGAPSVRAETAAGGIIAKLLSSSGERSDSVLETTAGDITVYLSDNLQVSIRAAIELANGHMIRSDFSDIHISSEGATWPGPRTVTAEGQLNGGGPVLKVRTSSGNINFRRASH